MTKKLVFATTNEGKLNEARQILGIDVEGSGFPIDEIQSLDSLEVAIKKAKAYFEKLNKPLLVEDVSLSFEALKCLPGAYINDFSKALGNEGLCRLIENSNNKNAVAKTVLVYVDEAGNTHEFIGEVKGEITEIPKGENGFGWDSIFKPQGSTKTFAEMTNEEKNKYSMRAIAFNKLSDWMKSN